MTKTKTFQQALKTFAYHVEVSLDKALQARIWAIIHHGGFMSPVVALERVREGEEQWCAIANHTEAHFFFHNASTAVECKLRFG